MIRKHFKLICTIVLAVTLTLVLSGCGREEQDLDGKNIVTFELNGGTLELKTSSVNTKVNYAYHPGTYILDPVEIPGYKMYRQGYNFTGWYTTAECKPTDKWDFKTPFNTETLTLYAGWEKAIRFTYTVYYVDGASTVALGSYNVSPGDAFNDRRNYASDRKDFTPMGYYSDASLTTAWDESFTHPGGEVDTDVAVYVDYIVGNWTLVSDAATLKSALKAGANVYLMADIDFGGDAMINPSITPTYSGVFEGNGHTVSNFKVDKTGSRTTTIAIFKSLGKGAEIRNVTFDSVAYDLSGLGSNVVNVKASALAVGATNGVVITNVSVTGVVTTNYTEALEKINSSVFDDAEITESGFTATITVNVQN